MKRKQNPIFSYYSKVPGSSSSQNVEESSQRDSAPTNVVSQPQETVDSTPKEYEVIPPADGRLTQTDIDNLNMTLFQDPGKRKLMREYHPSDRVLIRRAYVGKALCQPLNHNFPQSEVANSRRRFKAHYLTKHKSWLEYSIEKDACFCFPCYLFSDEVNDADASSRAFVYGGFKSWNKTNAYDRHIGGLGSAHNLAVQKLEDFKSENGSLNACLNKQSEEARNRETIRLEASILCLEWLLLQGLATRGHDESSSSLNRGNFIELLKFHARGRPEVSAVVLDNAPGNCKWTSPKIQKQIIRACAKETTLAIIDDIGDGFFSILADESADVTDKEQMALCLRYVSKGGEVMERFFGIVHVTNTTSLTLKQAIENMLMNESLPLSKVRGQGYDGASNMQGHINGLQRLIRNESPSAYHVHCFAHQLQLALVSVDKHNDDAHWLFEDVLPPLITFIGGSPKRKAFLQKKQRNNVVEALSTGELETGRGLNQAINLVRPGDTRWGSHFRTIKNVLVLFRPILESLDAIYDVSHDTGEKSKVCGLTTMLMCFDFVFVAHLMGDIFAVTDELNMALQRRDQDIVNAMCMVDSSKRSLQRMRDSGWSSLFNKVTSFMVKHELEIPNMEDLYGMRGRKFFRGKGPRVTNLHHFQVEVFNGVLDRQLSELEDRFSKESKELLTCMACFNPRNRFSSFDVSKLVQLAGFYPNEFPSGELMFFEHALRTFEDDMKHDERFWNLKNLNELSIALVKTGKHEIHFRVYLLLKLVLLLPVATASVERVFSGMTYIKNKLRNSMGDQLLNDNLVTYLERDLFLGIGTDVIAERWRKIGGSRRLPS